MVGLRLRTPPWVGAKKFDVFIYLSIRLLDGEVCELEIAIKTLEFGKYFDTVE